MITALIYTRVSTDEQARDGLSLPAQLSECERYAQRMGWVLGRTYRDVMTGKRDDRPEYQQLLADVRTLRSRGESIAVVVAALDRFGRRLIERIRSREELKLLGVPTHSVREGGEVSDLVANILGAVAQEEVRRLSERVTASRQHSRSLGWKPGGRAPWGFLWRPATETERQMGAPAKVLELNDVVAPYALEAFQRIADGSPIRRVTEWIHSLPESARDGRQMPYPAVAHMLRSPVYVGRPDRGDPSILARPNARWAQIVTDELWTRAQAQIASHAQHHKQATGRYLLTGYFHCPLCSYLVVGNTHAKSGVMRYRCARMSHANGRCFWSVRTGPLDAKVLKQVGAVLSAVAPETPHFARVWRELSSPGEVETYRETRTTRLKSELAQHQKRLLATTKMYVDGGLDRAGYELIRDSEQAQITAVEQEIERVGLPRLAADIPSLRALSAGLGHWRELLEQGTVKQKRDLLATLVESIDVTRTLQLGKTKGDYRAKITWTKLGDLLRKVDQRSLERIASL